MFRRSRSKSRQPGPTAIPDEAQSPVYHCAPPPALKKKKHSDYSYSSRNNNSGSRRGRSSSTPHVRFSSETLDHEREHKRSSSPRPRSGGIFGFADYFSRRLPDPPRRYRDYHPHEGHISMLADPEAQRQGREHRRHHHAQSHSHHNHHSHHSHSHSNSNSNNRRSSRRRHSIAAPSPAPEYCDEWPESIYYLGTPTSPPLFLSERESHFRRRRERGLHEFLLQQHHQHHPHHQAPGAAQSDFEYVERKSLPPGHQLRRVHSFWRSEDGRYY